MSGRNYSAYKPRILLGPMNFADQPMTLARSLKERGYYAHHIQYSSNKRHPLGYPLDRVRSFAPSPLQAQLSVLLECIEEGFDIYHFWQRSLIFNKKYSAGTAFDLPILKTKGSKIVHRFTGFDLRLPKWDVEVNHFSPFNNGYKYPFDEDKQEQYIEFLKDYVDIFVVQDPEMRQFFPSARVIPRMLDLSAWPCVGVNQTNCPVVVHAPTSPLSKGSDFIENALDTLRREGLHFDYRRLDKVSHQQAKKIYREADIIIDQILIGATGVLTLEAWALGKPCVVFLREDLFGPFYGTTDLPVANANPETIERVLRNLIRDQAWRDELSRKGRAFAERHHASTAVIPRYLDLYAELVPEPPAIDRSSTGIAFLRTQLQPHDTPLKTIRVGRIIGMSRVERLERLLNRMYFRLRTMRRHMHGLLSRTLY